MDAHHFPERIEKILNTKAEKLNGRTQFALYSVELERFIASVTEIRHEVSSYSFDSIFQHSYGSRKFVTLIFSNFKKSEIRNGNLEQPGFLIQVSFNEDKDVQGLAPVLKKAFPLNSKIIQEWIESESQP